MSASAAVDTGRPATGTVRLHGLGSPIVEAPKATLILGGEGEVEVALPCYLVEHERGAVLIDTGLDPAAADDATALYGEELGPLIAAGFEREHAVDAQLSKHGLDPADIETVVITHLHFDHTGAMRLFPNAQFIGGVGEVEYAFWPDPASLGAGYYRLEDFGFLRDNPARWWEVGPSDHDLFGDGSVVLFHLSGHTPGQLAVLVRTADRGNILLASDVVHLREGLAGVPFPLDWDFARSARSIRKLQAIAHAHQAEIWVHHDADDWRRFAGGGD